MSDLPEVAEAMTVRPGQTLIVRVDRNVPMTKDKAAEIRSQLVDRLPGVEVIVICCDQILAYDPSSQEEAR